LVSQLIFSSSSTEKLSWWDWNLWIGRNILLFAIFISLSLLLRLREISHILPVMMAIFVGPFHGALLFWSCNFYIIWWNSLYC
jgi:hypothetical protein